MENENSKKENQLPSGGVWWRTGVQMFTEVSTWIVVPIILALIAGNALDAHYSTKPLMLLVCAGAGFLISIYGIMKTVKNYTDKLKKEEKK
jgi:F0F1-type ATP synthase assembly protein I